MALTCETCGQSLTRSDLASGRCPKCRSRVKRGTPEKTLAVGGIAEPDGTMLPGSMAPANVGSDVDVLPADDGSIQGNGDGHRATVDTSVSLANPAVQTIEATDAAPPPASPPKGQATVESVAPDGGKGTLTSNASSSRPVSRRNDSVATVDPRFFEPSEWDRWGQSLAGKTGTASPRRSETPDERRSVSTDSRYVGKTPVAPRPLTPQGAEPLPGDEYSISGRLGEGGMGIVFTATQRAIAREVALKTLKPDTARRRDRRDNLATEAIVTGELAHPNIVPVYDLGQDADGSLFYSMKKVEGIRWDTVIDKKTEAENLDILLRVADAVAFAHDRGVVNRDLKPENVFLGGFGEVLVMDWGLAFATDRFKKLDNIVENASMGGSPAYMAPEQARNFLVAGGWRPGELEPITPALDLYLLGAMLFEIVTGQPPHGSDDPTMCVMAAAENRIRHHESTSQLLPIALKAMATDPKDRYHSVLEFQQAIREYLSHAESLALTDRAQTRMKEGDLARAVVAFEDALSLWPENPEAKTRVVVARRRLTRRRYALTAMTAGFFLAIASGGTASTIFWREAEAETKKAQIAANDEKKARKDADSAREKEAEQRQLAESRQAEAERQKRIADGERQKAQSEEQKAVAAREKEQEQRRLAEDRQKEAERQKTLADQEREKAVIARNEADKERERQAYLRYKAEIANVDRWISENKFSEANSQLDQLAREVPAFCGWEWGRLKYLCTQGRQAVEVGASVAAASAAPDGTFLVTADSSGKVQLWERDAFSDPARGARLSLNAPVHAGLSRPLAVAVSGDGGLIAAAGESDDGDPAVLIWPTGTQERVEPRRLLGHSAGFPIHILAFFADGSKLMSASAGGQIIVWDLNTDSILGKLDSTEADFQTRVRVSCGAVSPDSRQIVIGTAAGGGNAFVWRLTPTADGVAFTDQRFFLGHQSKRVHGDGFAYRSGAITSVTFSPDSQFIYSGDGTGHVLRWDPQVDAKPHADLMASQLAAAEQRVAEALESLTRTTTAENVAKENFAVVPAYEDTSAVLSVSVRTAPDGRSIVATAGENGVVKLWEPSSWDAGARSAEELAEFRGHDGRAVAALPVASADGWDVFSAGEDGSARLWQIDRYAEVKELAHETLAGHEDAILAAEFDPTGQFLMTSGAANDRRIAVTDLRRPDERREVADIAGVAPGTSWVVPVGSDGQHLLTASADGSTVFWDAETRTPIRRLFASAGNASLSPAASPDGKWIAVLQTTRSNRREIGIWPTDALAQGAADGTEPISVKTRGEPAAAAFAAGSQMLVAGDAPLEQPLQGGFVYINDLASEEKETVPTLVFGDGEGGRVAKILPLPNGDMIIAGKPGKESDIRLLRWDPRTRKTVAAPQGTAPWAVTLEGAVDLPSAAIDASGRWLIALTTTRDRAQMLQLWDLTVSPKGPVRQQGPLSSVRVTGLSISDDGSTLLVATEPAGADAEPSHAATIRLLDRATLEEVMFGDESLLMPKVLGDKTFPTGVTAVTFAEDDSHAFVAGARGVYEFDLTKRERLPGLFGSHGAIPASSFSSDGKYLLSGRQDGSFDIYDTTSDPSELTPLELEAPGVYFSPVVAAAFSPVPGSYQFLIARDKALEVYEFDPASRKTRLVRALTTPEDGPTFLATAAFSADGRWIAAAGNDGLVRLFDVKARDKSEEMLEIDAKAFAEGVEPLQHTGRVTSVAIADTEAPNGRLVIASGSEDQTTIVWVIDPASRRLVTAVPLKGHTRAVTSVAFAPGHFDRLLTGSNDRTARLWDWDGGGIDDWENAEALAHLDPPSGETLTLSGMHSEGLTVVGFSPDGLTALTAAQDGRAVLWPSHSVPDPSPSVATDRDEDETPAVPRAEEE